MKHILIDILLALAISIALFFFLQDPKQDIQIEIFDQELNPIIPSDIAIIHYWAPWSKPSVRQLHLFHRFTQTHPDIQLIAVHSQEESPQKIIDFKIENGWYFPFAQSNILPNQLPQTIIHINEQDLYLDGSIHYERLLEIFERDH